MKLLSIFFNRSKLFYAAFFLLGFVNVLLNIGILSFINNILTSDEAIYHKDYDWMLFFGLIVVSLGANAVFQSYMVKLTNDIKFDLEFNILEKLRFANYRSFEKLGNEKIFTAIDDIRTMVNLPELIVSGVNAIIIVICCFAYLFYMSWVGALMVIGMMAALFVFYMVRNNYIEKDLNKVRTLRDDYYKILDDLIHGFKEVRTNPVRSENLFEKFLLTNRMSAKDLSLGANIKYMVNELTGNYSWYVVFGLILFAMPMYFAVDRSILTSYMVTVLYMMGPISLIITLIPAYTHIKIALSRLGDFHNVVTNKLQLEVPVENSVVELEEFENLRFEDIVFEYNEGGVKSFTLGPINFEINKGKIIFITGGNGSGKSTFMNILAGLFRPVAGNVYFNNKWISGDEVPKLRDYITTIFTTPHLFAKNYNNFEINENVIELKELIELMRLEGKLEFTDNNISPKLSKGQQKRLAMILSLLEHKPIILLDEWAAEQDPVFRAFFYRELLPKLKDEGKTIIAVTHDDHYFDVADELVKFNYGKIEVSKQENPVLV